MSEMSSPGLGESQGSVGELDRGFIDSLNVSEPDESLWPSQSEPAGLKSPGRHLPTLHTSPSGPNAPFRHTSPSGPTSSSRHASPSGLTSPNGSASPLGLRTPDTHHTPSAHRKGGWKQNRRRKQRRKARKAAAIAKVEPLLLQIYRPDRWTEGRFNLSVRQNIEFALCKDDCKSKGDSPGQARETGPPPPLAVSGPPPPLAVSSDPRGTPDDYNYAWEEAEDVESTVPIQQAPKSLVPYSPSPSPSPQPSREATPENEDWGWGDEGPSQEDPVVEWEEGQEPPRPIKREPGEVPELLPPAPHQLPGFNPTKYYALEKEPPLKFKNGPIMRTNFKIRFTQPLPEAELEDTVAMVMAVGSHAIHALVRRADPRSYAQIIISNDKFYTRGFQAIARQHVQDITFEQVAEVIEKVLLSEKGGGDSDGQPTGFTLEDTLFNFVTYLPMQVGAWATGLQGRNELRLPDFVKAKGCILNPMAKSYVRRMGLGMENMCIPLCIAAGLRQYQLGYHPLQKGGDKVANDAAHKEYKRFLFSSAWRDKAKEMVTLAGLGPGLGPFRLDQIQIFHALPEIRNDVQICVYEGQGPPTHTFGPSPAKHYINLFCYRVAEDKFHAVLITSMAAFNGKRRFCEHCKKSFYDGHKCEASKCRLCSIAGCANETAEPSRPKPPRCIECQMEYKTQHCFEAHKRIFCSDFQRCLLCWQRPRKNDFDKHLCGKPCCPHCKASHLPTEYCYVRPVKGKKSPLFEDGEDLAVEEDEEEAMEVGGLEQDIEEREQREAKKEKKKKRNWYGDAETVTLEDGSLVANLFVFQGPDPKGNLQQLVYKGLDAAKKVLEDLVKKKSPFKDTRIFFHNGARFDSHLLFKEFLLAKMVPKYIAKGQSLISMDLKQNGVQVRDSLQFLPGVPLAKFPQNFGLECGDKGYFPHKLNTERWVNFEDPQPYLEGERRFPGLEYFHPEAMRPSELAKLRRWHEEQEAAFAADPAKTYSPTDELLMYCCQEVRILREGFEKYRQEWLAQHPDMDPAEFVTFPQFNNAIFRTKYMKPESLCLLPPQGYELQNNRGSKEAFAWIHCLKAELRTAGLEVVEERTGRKGFEVRIAGCKVDGFLKDSLGRLHILQYHGCYFHGCPEHGPKDRETGEQGPRAKASYEDTLEKSRRLRDLSQNPNSPYGLFVYHEMWSHDFAQWRKKDHPHSERIKKFYKMWSSSPLSPRDGFFGGRTNCIVHNIPHVPEGHQIKYVDFTSLYPAVMWSTDGQLWPVGHPKIYIGAEVEEEPGPPLDQAFGLWKVTVHPPRNLRHPVLGQSINGKLTFALCRTCAEVENADFCEHTKDERAISGVFFTEELKVARDVGYEVGAPVEVWDWPPEQRTADMFRAMIGQQYTKKCLSSKVQSEEELQDMVEELFTLTGHRYSRQDFQENASLRALAKFSINNVWGYLGKREDMVDTEFIDSMGRIDTLLNDPTKDVKSLNVVMGGDYVEVRWKPKAEAAGKNGNIVTALMTTAYARLKLYAVMRDFAEQVVYFDTDSLFLLLPPGMAGPPTSSRLGELKDEIRETFGPGFTIGSFTSLGPKTYMYTVVEERTGEVVHTEIKAKGISLTTAASGVVTAEAVGRLEAERDAHVLVPQFTFGRQLNRGRLFARDFVKRFRFSSTKRWLRPGHNPTHDTLPYGYSH